MKGLVTLLAAGTAAATAEFSALPNIPVTLVANGMTSETVALEISYDGSNFTPVVEGGTAVVLGANDNPRTIYGPGLYRVVRGAGSESISVAIWTNPQKKGIS